jgi:enoyl-CoA hydratase/carnithine racemase
MATETAAGVRIEREGPIATIVLDQPDRHNALKVAGWRRISELAEELAGDTSVRVVGLRGAGQRAFCAGADISEFETERATPELADRYNALVSRALNGLAALPQPVIAVIHGFCIGGGCEVALMADIRLASQDAQFGIPAARLGISIGYEEIRRLVQVVGPAVAKQILFTAGRFDAAWALRSGLVNAVYPGDQLDDEASRVMQSIVDAAPTSVRWSKHAVQVVLDDPTLSSVVDAAAEKARLFGTEDFQEGVRAFLEKRPPRFSGR